MLRRVEARLAGEFVGAELDRRARISAQLEQVVAEAWAAWRSTQGPVETVTTVTGRAELSRDGLLVDLPDQVTTQRKVQAGEAALLGKVLDGLAALRALHGVDEPKAVDVTSGGEPIKLYSCVPVDEV
jgi:hypothetical protein